MASNEVQTFVFFDLETTAINTKPRITELSMIAVSRKDLISTMELRSTLPPSSPFKYGAPPLPRVVHKLTRLYNPNAFIHPMIEEITGLSNEMLHHLPTFGAESVSAIKLFLNLPPPVCLIAHNGNGFDFPILKAELIKCDCDILNDILCADSLLFARYYEAEDIRIATELAKDFKDDDDIYIFPDPPTKAPQMESFPHFLNKDVPSPDLPDDFNPVPGYQTPEKSIINISTKLPNTPMKANCSSLNGSFTPIKAKKNHLNGSPYSPKSKICRTLNYDISEMRKKPFSQPNLYRRLFRSEYDAHRAEDDAQALLQICSFHGYDFAKWVDVNNEKFLNIKPKWNVRKSFVL